MAINSSIVSSGNPNTTVEIFNPVAVSAGTEYSQALPVNTKKFIIKARTPAQLKISYTVSESGTKYVTLNKGCVFEDINYYASQSIYFQSDEGNTVVEIVAYY